MEKTDRAHLNTLTASACTRLCKALGREQGMHHAQSTLHRMGLQELSTPQDLLIFANHLCVQGGAIEAVARSLKITAILRGAVDPSETRS